MKKLRDEIIRNSNHTITSLDLDLNDIGPDGAQAIAEALNGEKCKITSLHFKGNNIGDAIMEQLAAPPNTSKRNIQKIAYSKARYSLFDNNNNTNNKKDEVLNENNDAVPQEEQRNSSLLESS